jgi:hypothetical protein
MALLSCVGSAVSVILPHRRETHVFEPHEASAVLQLRRPAGSAGENQPMQR